MSEQRYEISTPLPSIDFLEEYNDEISSNDEFECEMLNETLDNTSDIHFEDPEKKKKNDCETFEHDEVIDNLEHTELTPCVVINFIKVDRDAINEIDGVLIRLGVCNTHFQFDNKYLHQSRNKQLKDFNQGIIQWRRCISCNKYITFYSRGAGCILHSWHLNKQNIQVPCIGQYTCEVLRDCLPVCKRAFDDINPRQKSVCCWCYENLGGHIHHRPGRGKSRITCTTLHADDTAKGLEYLGNWLINIAQTGNDKEKILTKVFEALLPFADLTFSSNSTITTLISTTLNEPPSLFMIKTLFIEFSKKQEIEKKLEIKEKELEKKEIEKKEIEKKLEIEDFEADFKEIEGELIYKTNFDAETIKRVLLTKLEPGCLGPSPNVVILEAGANLNSDEEILHVSEMYKEDFAMNNHSFLDIIADEAIFRRLIKCREKWPNIRPHLGQWHTSKDFCSVLIIWYLYYKWAGIWKVHRMGMRIGNFGLQRNSLSAAAPLYASAAKFNYTTAIAHYLSIIAAHPKLEERLNYCGAFKIPCDVNEDSRHVCFGFDEALETFGVRDQIKFSQDERERIDLLMSEYLNDYAVSYSERAIKSRKESLWKLVNDLITVFGMSDPLSHQLFQEYTPTEMHKEGLSRLFDCYPNGLERIKAVYRQEVLKTEDRNPQGRRTIGVVRTKVKDYNSKKKAEKRKIVIPELTQPVLEDLNETPLTIEPQSKRRKTAGARHRTTEDETAILCALKIYKNYLPEDAIGSVREKLSEVWTVKKVREWWNYHKNKEL
ncbi:hypothetical protein RclHR1_08740006 [Rhizophagus clarus]|uniref:Uncharacterized protein n=1 Tax=Rhizophagus clarus TaxID=94130 RepID=A0A2Z6S251_9GLOM|nr:hypothetical protein RclHR1_08740006 [Rhizophagus clarus]